MKGTAHHHMISAMDFLITIIIVSLTNSQMIGPITASSSEQTVYDFSLVWMTDTQHYSAHYPSTYYNMTSWIVNKRGEMKIQYVIHTGDIVDTPTDDHQWKNANDSMSVLDNVNVPYGVLGGNHDGQDGFQNFNKYFGAQRFQGRSYYHADNDGNHYDLITSNGVNFVIVYLSYGIDSSERTWASEVFRTYVDRIGILAVHNYINSNGNYTGNGSDLHNDLVAPNRNVWLVLCGHVHGAHLNVRNAGSRTYYELLSDYQDLKNGGKGYQKILNFDMAHNTVHVRTYSTILNQYGGTGYKYDEFDMELPSTTSSDSTQSSEDQTSLSAYQIIETVALVAVLTALTAVIYVLRRTGRKDWRALQVAHQ
jgi:predicted phosphodiesterase